MKNSNKQKIATAIIAMTTLLSVGNPAFAAENQSANISGDTSVAVNGQVEASTIKVTVPTELSFEINANADTSKGEKIFTSTKANVENQTRAPIDLSVMSIKAKNGTNAKVYSPDTYTDSEWLNLGVKDTESKIALGIKQGDNGLTVYSPSESKTSTDPAGTFKVMANNSTDISVQSKYGLAWSSEKNINYELILRVGLSGQAVNSSSSGVDISAYSIKANASTGGTVTGYANGNVITLTAVPSNGYKFSRWSDGDTNTVKTFTVTKNETLTAYFVTQ